MAEATDIISVVGVWENEADLEWHEPYVKTTWYRMQISGGGRAGEWHEDTEAAWQRIAREALAADAVEVVVDRVEEVHTWIFLCSIDPHEVPDAPPE